MSNDFYNTYILPHAGLIVKLCRSFTHNSQDFNDYYQEVCLQIWRSHDRFNGQAEWSTWVYRLTLNVCLTLVRKEERQKQENAAFVSLVDTSTTRIYDDNDLESLHRAIKQLKEIDRGIIVLYLEEHSYKEIAEMMDTTPNNIAVRVNRIKDRLKKIMNK